MFLWLCSICKRFLEQHVVFCWLLNVLLAANVFRVLVLLYLLYVDYGCTVLISVYWTLILQWLTRRQAHMIRAQQQGIPLSEYGVSPFPIMQAVSVTSWKLHVIEWSECHEKYELERGPKKIPFTYYHDFLLLTYYHVKFWNTWYLIILHGTGTIYFPFLIFS